MQCEQEVQVQQAARMGLQRSSEHRELWMLVHGPDGVLRGVQQG